MSYRLSDKELVARITCCEAKRYDYAVEKMADWEKVWSQSNAQGWVLTGTVEEKEVVPIWPHPRFAQLCATGVWADCDPRMITLNDWLEEWLPGLSKDDRLIVVFPVPGSVSARSPAVSPAVLRQDLEAQLALIE
jgi:hypothetical protein